MVVHHICCNLLALAILVTVTFTVRNFAESSFCNFEHNHYFLYHFSKILHLLTFRRGLYTTYLLPYAVSMENSGWWQWYDFQQDDWILLALRGASMQCDGVNYCKSDPPPISSVSFTHLKLKEIHRSTTCNGIYNNVWQKLYYFLHRVWRTLIENAGHLFPPGDPLTGCLNNFSVYNLIPHFYLQQGI